MWDSSAQKKHRVETNCPPRSDFQPGDPNILHESLDNRKKLIFRPLVIKVGLMKQFVKAVDTDGDCFKYINLRFPRLSVVKNKAGVFDGPQIRHYFFKK